VSLDLHADANLTDMGFEKRDSFVEIVLDDRGLTVRQ